MSRTLYIELSQMKSSASESIKNDGLFQFGTALSREPRSLKTKLCWPFNSERRILCGGLYRLLSSNTYYCWWTNWKEQWIRILEKQRNSYHTGLQHRLVKDSSIQFHWAAPIPFPPPPPQRATVGHMSDSSVTGWGICKICAACGPGFSK